MLATFQLVHFFPSLSPSYPDEISTILLVNSYHFAAYILCTLIYTFLT